MEKIIKKHTISFVHAWEGIRWALTTQPNFRIHILFAIAALFLCVILGVSATHVAIIVFAIVLGFAGEMINTALESMTDLITKEYRQEAKIAKDVAAGMMLLIAIGTTVVALFVFGPYIVESVVGY